jgi:hypothetical protein
MRSRAPSVRGGDAGEPVLRRQSGQAALLLVAALGFVAVGALILGAIAAGVGVQGRDQRAADLAARRG